MDELHLTRSGLESMTTAELVRVADSFGIDIPPGLDRVFVIEELLDLASLYGSLEGEEDSPAGGGFDETGSGGARPELVPGTPPGGTGVFSPEEPEGPLRATVVADPREGAFGTEDFPGSVPFPKQYNITFIEVLIRDPLWAFTFWEIKEHDREIFERTAGFEGYCLRVNSLGEKGAADPLPGFTVPVGPEDTAWYIGFPSENTGGRFQVELCVRLGERIEFLASSRVFTMPRLQERAGLSGRCFSKLALLSGAEEFPILRNPDRKVRPRQGREFHRPDK
jgi:hypothetical protein